jgi:hypothetical protein
LPPVNLDAVAHAPDEADEHGQAVAGRAEELEALVGELQDVGDETDADDVEGEAAEGPAVFLIGEFEEVGPAAAAGQDRGEGFFGRRDAEVAEEGIAGPGRDLADLEPSGGAAVGVEAVEDFVGRAVAAETDQAIIRGGRGLAADLDGVARALGDADIEAGEGVAQARFELFEHLPAPAVSGGRIHDEQRFHRGTFWHL